MHFRKGRIALSSRSHVALLALVVAVGVTAFASAAAAASGQSGQIAKKHPSVSDKGITLTVGYQTADLPALWQDSGVFKNTPYTIKYAVIAGPAAQISALDAGQIDVGEAGDNTGAFQVANSPTAVTKSTVPVQGVAVTWVPTASERYRSPLYVTKASGIKSLKGLKGHTVGYNQGGNIQAGYLAVLGAAKLKQSQIKPVVFQSNQLAADAFVSGQLDAVVSSYTSVFKLVQEGKAIEIAGPAQLGLIGGNGYLATRAALTNPAKLLAIKDFFTRLKKFFTSWYPKHKSKVISVYEKLDDQLPVVAKDNYALNKDTQFYDVASKPFLKIEQKGVDKAYSAGFLKSNRNIDIGYSNVLASILGGTGS